MGASFLNNKLQKTLLPILRSIERNGFGEINLCKYFLFLLKKYE